MTWSSTAESATVRVIGPDWLNMLKTPIDAAPAYIGTRCCVGLIP